MNIGNKIKQLRLKDGITQEALANAMGVSCQSVSKWENNVCAPDISLLPALSEFFGVTIDELFDLSTEQKLSRFDNMLEYESKLSDYQYHDAEKFLLNLLPDYDKKNSDKEKGRIESSLAHLYHHKMMSEGRKVSDYARQAILLHPEVKQDQWLLQDSEYAVICDWNCANHNKTITFFKEVVAANPELPRNYLYLMDNLLADHRVDEAKEYFNIYAGLENGSELHRNVYPIRIALAEFKYDDAVKMMEELEAHSKEKPDELFDLAGINASLCRYDKAIELYEKSYELDEKPRYYDALWGISTIYEIQGRFNEALATWDRIADNLREEWNCKEGAPMEEVESQKRRIKNCMQQ